MHDYEPHPATTLFPLLGEDELQKLADDIRAHGLLEPIVLYEGNVLDGRNRLEACKRAGVDPRFVQGDGSVVSPILYVLSKNLHRRHLSQAQLAAISAEAAPLLREEARRRQGTRTDLTKPREKNDLGTSTSADGQVKPRPGVLAKLAEAAHVGEASIQRASWLKEHAPEEFDRVKRGEVPVHTAYQRARRRDSRLREGSAKRAAQICELAAQGCRADQIAARIGISVERVRLLAKRHDIQLPDQFIGKKPKLDVNRIVQETVIGAQGLVAGLDLVEGNLDQLDRAQVPGWVTVLAASIKTLTRLLHQLKELSQ